jgi:hypothetical protein
MIPLEMGGNGILFRGKQEKVFQVAANQVTWEHPSAYEAPERQDTFQGLDFPSGIFPSKA